MSDKPFDMYDVANELDELYPMLEFFGQGIATAEVDVSTGACFALLGVSERLKALSEKCVLTAQQCWQNDVPSEPEEPTHA